MTKDRGIFPRYLHKLFQGQEFSIGQWIREIRLQGAEADIRRSFKIRFGITPKEARRG